MKIVYVVTGFDLGWDNVVGVYDADKVSLEQLQELFPNNEYYIDDKQVAEKV